MKRNLNSALAVVVLCTVVAACSKKEAPPPPEPPKAQKAPAAAQPVVPVQKQLSAARQQGGRLDFSKKTDPFKPFVAAAPPAATPAPGAAAGAAPAPSADLLPIQSFDVSKFKVAGIVAGLKENRALLVDPNGKGYVVQAGMQIGPNEGRITRITANSVEVVERFKADNGRFKTRKIVLPLAKKR